MNLWHDIRKWRFNIHFDVFSSKVSRGATLPPLPASDRFYCYYRPPKQERSPAGPRSTVWWGARQHSDQFLVLGHIESGEAGSHSGPLSALSRCSNVAEPFWADFLNRRALLHTRQRLGEVSLHLGKRDLNWTDPGSLWTSRTPIELGLKELSNKEPPIGKLYYLRPMRFIVENSPSFDLPLCYTAASQTSNSNISGLRNQILNYFMLWYRGPGGFDWWKKQEIKISCHCPFEVSSRVPEAGPPDVQYPLHVRLLLRQHPGGLPWDPAGSGNTKITAVGKIHRAFSQRVNPRWSTTVGPTDILYICTALGNIYNIV